MDFLFVYALKPDLTHLWKWSLKSVFIEYFLLKKSLKMWKMYAGFTAQALTCTILLCINCQIMLFVLWKHCKYVSDVLGADEGAKIMPHYGGIDS